MMLSHLMTRRTLRAAALTLGAVLVAGSAAAQPDKCAQLLGKEFRKWAKTGQKNQDKCHKLANKLCIGSEGVCNDPDDVAFQIVDKAKYESTKTKGLAKIHEAGGACSTAAAVLGQFPGDDPANATEYIDDMLADRGATLLGDDDLGCNEAKVTCFSTISKQRAAVADKMLNAALKCQADGTPGEPLDPQCLDSTPIQSSIDKAEAKISEDCTGISGSQIGTCTPLPTCVTAGAVAEGREVATRAYPDDNCGDTPTANARTASIDIDTPTDLGGITLEVKYPRFAMGLPDNGDVSFGDFSNFTVSFIAGFDLDGVVRINAVDFNPISSGQLVDVLFDTCNPLNLGQCNVGGADCEDNTDCGANGPCDIENGFCSFSEFINCGDSPLPGCPVGESCTFQQALTTCTVALATDTFGNPVDGVTCTVSLSEP
jgi:hypothetical protein